ncbi:MAG: hypothetical protein HUJ51_04165 [Eggerthellaceae bacterium]|nr:hypothetical protein [Eggerthellaceae bacterium]
MKNAYLLGAEISDSKLPAIYRSIMKSRGSKFSYQPIEISQLGMAEAFIREKDYAFCMVENPFKGIAFDAADNAALTVKLARGANLLINMKSQIIAANTEGDAAVRYLMNAGFNFHGKNVAICGTGCTALAILHACALNGADSLCLISRKKFRAEKRFKTYASTLKKASRSEFAYIPTGDGMRSLNETFNQPDFLFTEYASASKPLKKAALIVNATRLGEKLGDTAAFDINLISEEQWVLDCVASEQETSLVEEVRCRTEHVLDGSQLQKIVAEISLDLVEDLV